MRDVSRRFRTLVSHTNRWVTEVEWSNDGGRTWTPAEFRDGSCTANGNAQIRWSTSLSLAEAPVGQHGINPFSTQLRIRHGIAGEPLLPMGRYKITKVSRSSQNPNVTDIEGSSHEVYLIAGRFVTSRTFQSMSARELATLLIREILPSAAISWRLDDKTLPKIIESRDRWPLVDGDRDATSIARSLGGRIYAGPSGEWIAAPVPALTDPQVWEATNGEDGVLLEAGEELSDDGVYNIMVVSGQDTSASVPMFKPGIAQDTDPLSLTFVDRGVEQGGFGPRPRFYASQLITSSAQAQLSARGMLAPYLGLKQQVSFSQAHDPSREVGDVGIVHTMDGPRKVIPDQITYSLRGQPLQCSCRTTATRLAGDVVAAPEDGGEGS